mgnify:FL=1
MKGKRNVVLIVAIILAAACLRAPITGVGSLVTTIKESLGIANSAAGMLTTIPLVTFSVLSIFLGKASSRVGAGKLMLVSEILLVLGILTRSFFGTGGLFLGTMIIGLAIAFGNVLLPGIIKAYFPEKVGIMTSIYTTAMSTMAAISSGISVPIATSYGWQKALVIWSILALLAVISWIPNHKCVLANKTYERTKGTIAKDSMAWLITLYMGIQSLLFYCFVAWFPTILVSKGLDKTTAGLYLSAYLFLGVPGNFVIPILAGRKKSQSGLGVGIGIINLIGMIGMMFVEQKAALILAVLCCGFCSGATISFALALFGLHTENAKDAAALSGLAQSVGYVLAAIGPTCMGKIYDITGSWNTPIIILIVFVVLLCVLGYLVGKEKIIRAR